MEHRTSKTCSNLHEKPLPAHFSKQGEILELNSVETGTNIEKVLDINHI